MKWKHLGQGDQLCVQTFLTKDCPQRSYMVKANQHWVLLLSLWQLQITKGLKLVKLCLIIAVVNPQWPFPTWASHTSPARPREPLQRQNPVGLQPEDTKGGTADQGVGLWHGQVRIPESAGCPLDRLHTYFYLHGFSWCFFLGKTLLLIPHQSFPPKYVTQSSHTQGMDGISSAATLRGWMGCAQTATLRGWGCPAKHTLKNSFPSPGTKGTQQSAVSGKCPSL